MDLIDDIYSGVREAIFILVYGVGKDTYLGRINFIELFSPLSSLLDDFEISIMH